ncbi:phosphoenolpyruvate carboxykinase AcuF [Capsaspora owczarzaki ATCC 30864]|uniref:phosphoenolpyruvate carboxykinase (ATP) n=1 Tax=Capsaspora owczarzaki (strain ATCC 30864) TaxID=595528 RepID=A0A0D2X3E2_CAPO3|nr:phosphoenolpyruvate carboxykinase AcuF [Capsaspora owczarzaki ATCC 30864]KJE94154.1 phosphoenolpyruvate carboxykinase AcuF [Capsaspora owczarzaki ATCC 30864]|eukprot:XP_004347589.1 phosphoenolpyruvate carboxykinase AcuF [Capsaspora owczarzaki ATCC 30864]
MSTPAKQHMPHASSNTVISSILTSLTNAPSGSTPASNAASNNNSNNGNGHDVELDICNDLENYGLRAHSIAYNASTAFLYEEALINEKGTHITSKGALATFSGAKTGRSPNDKRVCTNEDIWWGPVNIKLDESSFMINRERAVDYLNMKDRLYVADCFAGWDERYRIKIRVICARAYHALFMQNMLIRPTPAELKNFGEPDYTIYNAGEFCANRYTKGMSSATSVSINFERKEMVILGTQYAGEMKKGVFTIMHYLMPKRGVLSLHSSANEGPDGDVTLFLGLSGTGKTSLSAHPSRKLIGDDEHCWTDRGVFNIEGGCYAKAIDLSEAKEPEIFNAIRFGTVVENVRFDEYSREVDYSDSSITENTRAAYPIEFIPNAKIPCVGGHPSNIILLTCDAFGVLPPVSLLNTEQAMYHFISGYTAKVAGTEEGVTEPTATFSACFGQPFLVWHPTRYAAMLAEKMKEHKVNCWLVSTGWSGGKHGVGKRLSIAYSRAIIDAIHSGELAKAEYATMPVFNLRIPTKCTGVPAEILNPINTWSDKADYNKTVEKLANLFIANMQKYASQETPEILKAGPVLP